MSNVMMTNVISNAMSEISENPVVAANDLDDEEIICVPIEECGTHYGE